MKCPINVVMDLYWKRENVSREEHVSNLNALVVDLNMQLENARITDFTLEANHGKPVGRPKKVTA